MDFNSILVQASVTARRITPMASAISFFDFLSQVRTELAKYWEPYQVATIMGEGAFINNSASAAFDAGIAPADFVIGENGTLYDMYKDGVLGEDPSNYRRFSDERKAHYIEDLKDTIAWRKGKKG